MFTNKEKELIRMALQEKVNYLTTGNRALSLADIKSMGDKTAKSLGAEAKALSPDQMRLVLELTAILEKL